MGSSFFILFIYLFMNYDFYYFELFKIRFFVLCPYERLVHIKSSSTDNDNIMHDDHVVDGIDSVWKDSFFVLFSFLCLKHVLNR